MSLGPASGTISFYQIPNTIGILLVYTLLHQFTTFIIIPSAVGMQPCCNATTEAHTARVKSQQAIGGITWFLLLCSRSAWICPHFARISYGYFISQESRGLAIILTFVKLHCCTVNGGRGKETCSSQYNYLLFVKTKALGLSIWRYFYYPKYKVSLYTVFQTKRTAS